MKKIQVSTVQRTADVEVIFVNSPLVIKFARAQCALASIKEKIEHHYVCKSEIKGFAVVLNDPSIKDNWSTKEIKKYCIENNIKICTMFLKGFGEFPNLIMDDTVNNLICEL